MRRCRNLSSAPPSTARASAWLQPSSEREVLHRVWLTGEAVAPRHREVLELGEVGVRVRIGAQLEEVEIDVVVGGRLDREWRRGRATRRRWGRAGGWARHPSWSRPARPSTGRCHRGDAGVLGDQRQHRLAVALRLHGADARDVEQRAACSRGGRGRSPPASCWGRSRRRARWRRGTGGVASRPAPRRGVRRPGRRRPEPWPACCRRWRAPRLSRASAMLRRASPGAGAAPPAGGSTSSTRWIQLLRVRRAVRPPTVRSRAQLRCSTAFGAAERDVEQPLLLVHRLGGLGVRDRDEAAFEPGDEHGVELEALGAVEREQLDRVVRRRRRRRRRAARSAGTRGSRRRCRGRRRPRGTRGRGARARRRARGVRRPGPPHRWRSR